MKYRELRGYKYDLDECEKTILKAPFPNVMLLGWAFIKDDVLTIRANYAWDGASGPTWDDKTNMRGSLVHDALYQLMREGHLPRAYREAADKELVRLCIEDGMNRTRAWVWYRAVRLFCGKSAKPFKKPRGRIVDTERGSP